MYSLTVRDHFMIAHSFTGEIFGPAQRRHGATYVVDASFMRPQLDANDLVVDIGRASAVLKATLDALHMRDLDTVDGFKGHNTTTEFLAYQVFERLRRAVRDGRLGDDAHGLASLKVTLAESHIAWASYEGEV